jgi:hypothetical protein
MMSCLGGNGRARQRQGLDFNADHRPMRANDWREGCDVKFAGGEARVGDGDRSAADRGGPSI